MLRLKIGNIFSDIEGELSSENYRKLQRALSFRPLGYEFSTMYNRWIRDSNGKKVRRMWDGWRRQVWKTKDRKRIYFPTGLLSLVREHFGKQGIKYLLSNCRVKPEKNIDLDFAADFTIRDYQDEVSDDGVTKGRGIIQIATGGGKTIVNAALIKKLGVKPFIIFVTSIDLLLQAKESLEAVLTENGEPITIGQIGGGVVDIRDINVMTVQTAVRAAGQKWDKLKFDGDDSDDLTPIEQQKVAILDLLRKAKGAICDEVQHWRAETCQLVARELAEAYYVYGCSATPYRDEGDDLMIQACFGKEIIQLSASELIRDKWLIAPSIKIVHVRGETSPYRQWQQLYKDQVSENVEYNEMVASIANSYIEEGRLVLVLVQQIKHGKMLASMIPESIFLSGNSPKKKREENIKKLREREISCIVSTVIFDEGIDVRPLDTLLLAGQGKCLIKDTLLPSNDGLLTMEELFDKHNSLDRKEDTFYPVSNGDIILDSTSGEQRITGLYYGGKQKCKKVILQNGLQIEGTFSHRIRILRNGKIRYCKLENIQQSDCVVIKKCSYLFGENEPIKYQRTCQKCSQVNLPNKMTPTLARLIAYCLTEGYTVRDDCIEISNIFDGDSKFFKEFEELFNIRFNRCKKKHQKGPDGTSEGWLYRFCNKELILYLRYLGVNVTSRYKEVPLSIRSSDSICIRVFLRAVFDAEGHVSKNGIEITMGSEKFIQTLQIMLLNLNIMSRVSTKKVKNQDYWRLKIEDSKTLNEFYLEINFDCDYKEAALQKLIKRKHNPNNNTIPGIKDICRTVRRKSSKKHSTIAHKKASKFLAKLAPSSNQEFTHNSLKLFLEFFNEDNWHTKYLKFLSSDVFEYIRVKITRTTFNKTVYDYTAPLHHYVANGTLSHNSKVRAMQRIGRILRPYPGKDVATAIDFRIHQKYLLEHSISREKMYRTEEEYQIEEIDP